LLLVLPVASVMIEATGAIHSPGPLFLIGKWWVFWAAGIRLFLAGLRQVLQPRFTAVEIFEVQDTAALPIVRELGFANLSMGLLGICSMVQPEWLLPGAIVGGLYYGLAGLLHVTQKRRNAKELTAMISDLLVFCLLLLFVICRLRELPS
jgi:hypothetical protein